MVTLEQAVNSVLSRIDDDGARIFNRERVAAAVQDGYDHLVRESECLFDQHYDETVAMVGNLTCDDERAFLTPDGPANFDCGLINYTGKDEFQLQYQVHAEGAVGAVQCTAPWEVPYVEDVISKDIFTYPEDTIKIERVTWDWRELYAESASKMEKLYARFKQNIQGITRFFCPATDGMFTLRLVPSPGTTGTYYTYSGSRGLLRNGDASEFGTETSVGQRGLLRCTDGDFHIGFPWGHPVRKVVDDKNTRMEVLRLGKPLDGWGFEIPKRFVKYVEFWAIWRLLLEEGPGQDLELAQHYKDRYQEGLQILTTRRDQARMQRVGKLGGKPVVTESPAVAQLPWQYGDQIDWDPSRYF